MKPTRGKNWNYHHHTLMHKRMSKGKRVNKFFRHMDMVLIECRILKALDLLVFGEGMRRRKTKTLQCVEWDILLVL